MKPSAKRVLAVMNVLCWIIFLGLCVRTGALLYSSFVSLVMNPEGAKNLYAGLNLSNLYEFSKTDYTILVSTIILISAAKAFVFYLLIRIFLKINYVHPFSKEVVALISRISYMVLAIGLVTVIGNSYCEWLTEKGVVFPDLHRFLGAGGEHLFFAGVIFFIAQICKRGVAIQSENELTV